jgi:TolA-binding protein
LEADAASCGIVSFSLNRDAARLVRKSWRIVMERRRTRGSFGLFPINHPRQCLSIAVLAFALAPGARADEASDREALLLFNTGSRFYRQKNWRDAAQSFGEFLRRFPGHRDAPEARFAAGYALHRTGDHAAAVEVLRLAAREDGPSWSAEASFYLGRSLEGLAGEAGSDAPARVRRLTEAAESYARAAERYAKAEAAGAGAAAKGAGAPRSSHDPARSPHDPARSPHDPARSPHDPARSPHDPARSPHDPARSPHDSAREKEDAPAKARDGRVLSLSSQGEALYQAGKHGESARALLVLLEEREALETSPYYQRGAYVLGLARREDARGSSPAGGPNDPAKRYRDARAALEVAAAPRWEKEPLWEEAAFLLARLAHEDGDLDAAIDGYGRVEEKGKERAAEASYHRALARYETGAPAQVAEARKALALFLGDRPTHPLAPRARFHEALAAFDLKDYSAAAAGLAEAARESPDLAGRALLRRGQALLLGEPRDPAGALEALGKAFDALAAEATGPGADPASRARAAEALYWKAEALSADEGALPAAAEAFGEVHARFARDAADLAEQALYQKAKTLLRAGRHAEGARASEEYRKAYPSGRARFLGEALLVAAECAFQADGAQGTGPLRREAPRYYREAAQALDDPAEAGRARYMEGIALYSLGDWLAAARALDALRRDDDARAAFPELPFFLADALAQAPRATPPSAEDRERWKRAVAHYGEYLAGSKDGSTLPRSASALLNMGLLQGWLDDRAGARTAFEKFLEAHPRHDQRAQVRFELASALLALEDLEGALPAYAAAAAEPMPDGSHGPARGADPLLPARALYQKAMIERRLKRPAAAAETLGSLLEAHSKVLSDPSAPARQLADDAHYQRAVALLEAGKTDEARDLLAKHLEEREGSAHEAEARTQLARTLLDQGRPGDALAAVEPLAAAEPSAAGRDEALYLVAWSHSALASGSAHHREEMETAYRKLIGEHPRSPRALDAMVELAQHLFNRKAYPEARKWFEEARAAAEAVVGPASPGPPQPTAGPPQPTAAGASGPSPEVLEKCDFGLGFIAFEEGEHAAAARLLDRVAENTPSPLVPRALFQAGRAHMKLGQAEEAAARFRRLADDLKERAGPLHEESLLRLGECSHQLRKYDDAVKVLDRALAEYPGGALRHEVRFARGFALQFAGRHEEAIEAYRAVVLGTRAPVAARAQYHIGECRVEEKKHREAAREFTTVIANFDFEGEYEEWVRRALLAAAAAYVEAGDRAAAEAQLRELAARFPASAEGKAALERLASGTPAGESE